MGRYSYDYDYYVYSISHPETKEEVYIGLTRQLEKRMRAHNTKETFVGRWVKDIRKEGFLPVFNILYKGKKIDSQKMEAEFIIQRLASGISLFNVAHNIDKKSTYKLNTNGFKIWQTQF